MGSKFYTSIESKRKVLNTLYEWESPERHWEPKDQFWYVAYAGIFTVIIAILAILQELIFIIGVIAFLFLWFIQAAIPPEITRHQILTIGIRTFGKLYKWSDIDHYWFSYKKNVSYLNLEMTTGEFLEDGRKQRLSLIIEPADEEELFYHLINYIDYGDKDEIQFNFLTQLLHGKHVDISRFLPEDIADQESYLANSISNKKQKVGETEDEESVVEEIKNDNKQIKTSARKNNEEL